MNGVQLSILTLIEEGQRLRDAGLKRATDHAERDSPGWQQKAFQLFSDWLIQKGRGRSFTIESFRIHCELGDLINKPPSLRAWGSVAVRASRAGLIKKIGHATVLNVKAHRCFCSLWEVV